MAERGCQGAPVIAQRAFWLLIQLKYSIQRGLAGRLASFPGENEGDSRLLVLVNMQLKILPWERYLHPYIAVLGCKTTTLQHTRTDTQSLTRV